MTDRTEQYEKLAHEFFGWLAGFEYTEEYAGSREESKAYEMAQLAMDTLLPKDPAAPVQHSMWLNAFACVSPTDKFAREVGEDIISLLKQSQHREGKQPLAPIFAIDLRVVAS